MGGRLDGQALASVVPWERGGGGVGRVGVMAALTRTSPTIFSRLVSDCQAERKLPMHNSLDLVFFTPRLR